MLKIEVLINDELFDEENNRFIRETMTLELEHSLVSISLWESKWEKPFLGETKAQERSDAETMDYIRCMTLTPDVPPEVYDRLTQANLDEIGEYINAKMTATWFADNKPKTANKEVITNEIIYYWMFSLAIPLDWENRHLNRLLTLVNVFQAKNNPDKKQKTPPGQLAAQRRALNAKRRAQTKSSG